MSLVIRLTTPAAVDYDLALAANYRFGAILDDSATLEQRVEEKLAQFSAGELEFECRNDDGWWDTVFATLDHLARYPDTFVVKVERDGAVRWEGDIDPLTVAYDRIARTVSFTVVGKLARLSRYSAETVRRDCPEESDWGIATSVLGAGLTLDAGEGAGACIAIAPTAGYAYVGVSSSPGAVVKVRLSDHTRIAVLDLDTGENNVQALAIDDTETYLYVTTYTTPAKVVKVRLSDFTKVGSTLDLDTGENSAVSAVWDSVTAHLYVGCYLAPAKIVKVAPGGASTPTRVAVLTLAAGENYPYTLALDSAAGYLYAGLFTSAGKIVRITLSDFTTTSTLTFAGGENSVRGMDIDVAGGYLYAALWLSPIKVVQVRLSDFTELDVETLSAGENEARFLTVDATGGYLYVGCNLTPGKIVKVGLGVGSAFARHSVMVLATGEDTPYAAALHDAVHALYIATNVTPSIVVRLHLPSQQRAGTLTDSGKAWTPGAFVNHVLIGPGASQTYASHDSGTEVITVGGTHGWLVGQRIALTGGTFGGLTQGTSYYIATAPGAATFTLSATLGGAAVNLTAAASAGSPVFVRVHTILGNEATTLSISGEAVTGAYQIRPTAWETYVDAASSLPRKMTSLGPSIADLGLLVGDKLIITRTGGAPSRIIYLPKRGVYYAGTYEASQQSVAIKHVGISAYPVLTAYEIGVDTDLTADMDLGDHVVCGTPFHRDRTVAQLVALLFAAAEVETTEYEVDLPTLTETVVEYADFSGQTVGNALAKLAELVCCVMAATPTDYIFQQRETALAAAAECGSLDLIASGIVEHEIDEQSFDVIRAEGADDTSVVRGLVSHLSREYTISAAWAHTYPWLKQICDRNAAVFLGKRSSADATILDGREKNLCADPSFEGSAAINASACQWKNNISAGTGESYAKSSERASHMRQSLKLVAAGSGAGVGVKQTLTGWTAGQSVRLTAAGLITSRTGGRLYVDMYGKDVSNAVVLDTSGIFFGADTAGEFQRKTETVVIPATCTQLWVRIFAGAGSYYTAYIDEVSVHLVGTKVDPQLLSSCTIGNDEFLLWAIREPLLSSLYPGIMELELRGTAVTAASSDYDTTSDKATPPQLIVESLTKDLYVPSPVETDYTATLSWPYPLAPAAKILVTVWSTTGDRPDAVSSWHDPVSADADSLEVLFIVSENVAANTRYADFTILYGDGRMSEPSTPYILPASV